jgi:hypothetical protein
MQMKTECNADLPSYAYYDWLIEEGWSAEEAEIAVMEVYSWGFFWPGPNSYNRDKQYMHEYIIQDLYTRCVLLHTEKEWGEGVDEDFFVFLYDDVGYANNDTYL